MTKRAVVSLSGGMDSSSLLAVLLASKEYEFIHCFAFDYGQRHRVELERVQALIESLKPNSPVSLQIINLQDVFSDSQSALKESSGVAVPKEEYNEVNLRATVVENRNVIFSSIIYAKALSISKLYNCDVTITLGVHNSDEAVYPDCRPQSTEMAKELFRISNYGSERIEYCTPFITNTKTEVLGRGLTALNELGLDSNQYYANTSSCYDPSPEGEACGKCATCRDRLAAFEAYHMKDPVKYN